MTQPRRWTLVAILACMALVGLFAKGLHQYDEVVLAGAVGISILPSPETVVVGQTFPLTITIQAGAQGVDGAEAHLNFDTTYLEVVTTTLGSSFDTILQKQFNNTAGTIDYAAGKLIGSPPSGTFDTLTIRLRAKAVTTGTTLRFNTALPRKTDLVYAGSSVLGAANNGLIIIQAAPCTLTGTLRGQLGAYYLEDAGHVLAFLRGSLNFGAYVGQRVTVTGPCSAYQKSMGPIPIFLAQSIHLAP